MKTAEELYQFLPRHIKKLVKAKLEQTIHTPMKEGYLNLESAISLWGTIGTDELLNQHPDSQALKLRNQLAEHHKLSPDQICVGNGSTELIDLVMRTFCNPGEDAVLCLTPGNLRVKNFARMNALDLIEIPLHPQFDLPIFEIRKAITEQTKLIFIENPNHILGTCFANFDLVDLVADFNGIVVIDESAIDYAIENSLISMINTFQNVIIVQSFSKAWGLAGLPVGVAYSQNEIIKILQLLKVPFSVNVAAQRAALKALYVADQKDRVITRTIEQREQLIPALEKFSFVKKVHPSQTNTLVIEVDNAPAVVNYLRQEEQIIVLDVSTIPGLENCIRINIGQGIDNLRLLKALKDMPSKTGGAKFFWKTLSNTLKQASVYLGMFKKIFGA